MFHLDNNEVPVVYLDSIGVIVGARVDYGVGFYPIRIAFGDIDSDGDIDIEEQW